MWFDNGMLMLKKGLPRLFPFFFFFFSFLLVFFFSFFRCFVFCFLFFFFFLCFLSGCCYVFVEKGRETYVSYIFERPFVFEFLAARPTLMMSMGRTRDTMVCLTAVAAFVGV